MYINEQTAQLILDAIAWCNKDWKDSLEWSCDSVADATNEARMDFVRFCRYRGIEGVERKVTINAYREEDN